jgi:hypothetical protein
VCTGLSEVNGKLITDCGGSLDVAVHLFLLGAYPGDALIQTAARPTAPRLREEAHRTELDALGAVRLAYEVELTFGRVAGVVSVAPRALALGFDVPGEVIVLYHQILPAFTPLATSTSICAT